MSIYSPKSKADMMAGFPMSPGAIVGKPSARTLFDVLLHLIACSQSHRVEGNNGLNLLHIAVTGQMYQHFLPLGGAGMEPNRAVDPGDTPVHAQGGDAAQRSNEKLAWERGKHVYAEENNMEAALIERLLQLIPDNYKKDFLSAYQREPNMTFQRAFRWFYNRYGEANETDREENRKAMDFEWSIADDFPVIADRIDAASRFGTYADAPIPDQDLVDAGCRILLRSGQFANEYTEWIGRAPNDKTWAHFKEFWPEKVSLKQRTANAARNFGFGGAAMESEIQQGINNFANAHAQTIATVNGL